MMKMKIWFSKLFERISRVKQKKFFLFGLVFGFLFFLTFLAAVYFSIRKDFKTTEIFVNDILNNQTENFEENYRNFNDLSLKWSRRLILINRLSFGLAESRFKIKNLLYVSENLVPLLPEILGKNGEKTYFVLLQNDKELRPTGGFLGSYAKLKFAGGGLSKVVIQDIYVPDGQLPGHVDPPPPIQEAFKQGWWKLRDANWDPDFPASAKTIDWFFQKGKEEKNDGMIAVNFSLFQNLIGIFGSLNLAEYQTVVNKDNFYQVAQSYSEVGFFPGSEQKKNILSSLGWAFLDKSKHLEKNDLAKVALLIFKSLQQRQILIYLNNSQVQDLFHQSGWDGAMKKNDLMAGGKINDYLYIVESNLGANKANCCVKRTVGLEVDFGEEKVIKEKLKIDYQNESKVETPQPPVFWGGNYLNYLRIYVPKEADNFVVIVDNSKLSGDQITISDENDFNLKSIGFFVKVPNLSEKTVQVDYELLSNADRIQSYQLTVQKQPGIEFIPFELKLISKAKVKWTVDNKEFVTAGFTAKGSLFKDEDISASFRYN